MIYRSGLEKDVAQQLKKKKVQYDYEPKWGKLEYTIPAKKATYLPDFYIKTKTGKTIIIECKGIWVYADRLKHLLIRQSHPDLDIRFIFTNPKNKIRKGSKTTYADICDGLGKGPFKGVKWQYAAKKIPTNWFNE